MLKETDLLLFGQTKKRSPFQPQVLTSHQTQAAKPLLNLKSLKERITSVALPTKPSRPFKLDAIRKLVQEDMSC